MSRWMARSTSLVNKCMQVEDLEWMKISSFFHALCFAFFICFYFACIFIYFCACFIFCLFFIFCYAMNQNKFLNLTFNFCFRLRGFSPKMRTRFLESPFLQHPKLRPITWPTPGSCLRTQIVPLKRFQVIQLYGQSTNLLCFFCYLGWGNIKLLNYFYPTLHQIYK